MNDSIRCSVARLLLFNRVLGASVAAAVAIVACGPAPEQPFPLVSTPIASPTLPVPLTVAATSTASASTVEMTQVRIVATLTAIVGVPASTPMSPPASRPLMGKVDVGGYRLNFRCFGEGSPTVVLDSGWNGDSREWEHVHYWVRDFTRVCVYDRAGLGASDPGPKPTSSQQIVRDLHALLLNAKVPDPYLLVGYSFGGFNVRLYAHQYPEEVIGLVLLDSSHPDQNARDLALLPPETPEEPASLKEWRSFLTTPIPMDPESNPAGADWQTSVEQVRAASSLGDIPLVVVSRSSDADLVYNYGEYPPDFPKETAEKLEQEWHTMQKELLRLSRNSRQVIAERSGHCIHCTQPNLVVDVIKDVVEEVRGR